MLPHLCIWETSTTCSKATKMGFWRLTHKTSLHNPVCIFIWGTLRFLASLLVLLKCCLSSGFWSTVPKSSSNSRMKSWLFIHLSAADDKFRIQRPALSICGSISFRKCRHVNLLVQVQTRLLRLFQVVAGQEQSSWINIIIHSHPWAWCSFLSNTR